MELTIQDTLLNNTYETVVIIFDIRLHHLIILIIYMDNFTKSFIWVIII